MYVLNKMTRKVDVISKRFFNSETTKEDLLEFILNGENRNYIRIDDHEIAHLVELFEEAGLRVASVSDLHISIFGENKEFLGVVNRLSYYEPIFGAEIRSVLYINERSYSNKYAHFPQTILELRFVAVSRIVAYPTAGYCSDLLGTDAMIARKNMLTYTIKIIEKIIKEYMGV